MGNLSAMTPHHSVRRGEVGAEDTCRPHCEGSPRSRCAARLRSGEGLECRTRSAVLRSPDRRANAFEKLILVASPPVAGYAPNTMSQAASAACSAIARVTYSAHIRAPASWGSP